MPIRSPALPIQPGLFGFETRSSPVKALPVGFMYQDELASAEEERDLVEQFEGLPFKPFEFHGFEGKRHIISFGFHYDFGGQALRPSDPIPGFLLSLRQKVANFAVVPVEGLQQILINKYAPDAGIGWHRDRPMFEDVIAVSLQAPCVLRLRRKKGAGWQRASVDVRPRSAYLLRGPVRREWEHSVPPVDQLRYSVTFRNFSKNGTPDGSDR